MLPALSLPCSWEAKTVRAPLPVHCVEHGAAFYSVVFTWDLALVTVGLCLGYYEFAL